MINELFHDRGYTHQVTSCLSPDLLYVPFPTWAFRAYVKFVDMMADQKIERSSQYWYLLGFAVGSTSILSIVLIVWWLI